jgi:hypothetical protein
MASHSPPSSSVGSNEPLDEWHLKCGERGEMAAEADWLDSSRLPTKRPVRKRVNLIGSAHGWKEILNAALVGVEHRAAQRVKLFAPRA